jgi:hypothetical protein
MTDQAAKYEALFNATVKHKPFRLFNWSHSDDNFITDANELASKQIQILKHGDNRSAKAALIVLSALVSKLRQVGATKVKITSETTERKKKGDL